jgi:hypothetical protein
LDSHPLGIVKPTKAGSTVYLLDPTQEQTVVATRYIYINDNVLSGSPYSPAYTGIEITELFLTLVASSNTLASSKVPLPIEKLYNLAAVLYGGHITLKIKHGYE